MRKTLLLLAFSLSICPLLDSKPIRIVGSDLLATPLVAQLEAFDQRRDDLDLRIALEGSASGLYTLEKGEADLAIIAISEGINPEGFVSVPLTFDIATVIVNAENPIKEISIDQLRMIFDPRAPQSVSQWGELGIGNVWAQRGITAHLPESRDSIVRSLFKHHVSGGGNIRSSVHNWSTEADVIDAVRKNAGAIGVIRGTSAPSGTKALYVSSGGDGFAYAPQPDSIYFGDYTLQLPYHLVFRREDQKWMKEALAFLLSDEVAQALEEAKYAPAPASERRTSFMEIGLGE